MKESDNTELPGGTAERYRADLAALGPDDFLRLGVQPRETRSAVIRRAASRASQSLAVRQLSTPNAVTELQLSQVAVSTYRLLDPRRRDDRQSQAHVGRIKAGVLDQAGRTEFADGDRWAHVASETSDGQFAGRGEWVRGKGLGDGGSGRSGTRPAYFGGATVLQRDPPQPPIAERQSDFKVSAQSVPIRPLTKMRRQARRPGIIVAIMIVLLVTAGAVWHWGQSADQIRQRFFSPALQATDESSR